MEKMSNRRDADKRPQCSSKLLVIAAIAVLLVVAILFIPNWEFLQKNRKQDYCSVTLCGRKKHHIACKNDGKFGKRCPKIVDLVPMTDELQTLIVDQYNKRKKRKGVAEGNIKWNPEFAQLAEYTAKTCDIKSDDCRNTEKFRNVIQKFSYYAGQDYVFPVNRYKNLTLTAIAYWIDHEKGMGCSQVGCAVVHFNKKDTKHNTNFLFIVCNYASENEPNELCKI